MERLSTTYEAKPESFFYLNFTHSTISRLKVEFINLIKELMNIVFRN